MDTLVLLNYVYEDAQISLDNQSRLDFKTAAYKGKPDHILVFQAYASFGVGSSSTPTVDRRTGKASVWFHNGTGNIPYEINKPLRWEAWVALKTDWKTPISNIIKQDL